jgi:hypothetical protein
MPESFNDDITPDASYRVSSRSAAALSSAINQKKKIGGNLAIFRVCSEAQ